MKSITHGTDSYDPLFPSRSSPRDDNRGIYLLPNPPAARLIQGYQPPLGVHSFFSPFTSRGPLAPLCLSCVLALPPLPPLTLEVGPYSLEGRLCSLCFSFVLLDLVIRISWFSSNLVALLPGFGGACRKRFFDLKEGFNSPFGRLA